MHRRGGVVALEGNKVLLVLVALVGGCEKNKKNK